MHKRRKPRALTLTLPNSQQPFLVFQGERYTLRNFNDEGIGLWLPSPAALNLTPGSQMSADVVIDNQIFAVKLEIRHTSPGIIGLKFTKVAPELSSLFRTLMEPSTYAASLKMQKDSGAEDKSLGFPRLWYAGEGQSELVVWFNPFQRMIIALQLCWLGKWVYRHQFEPVQTGHLKNGVPPTTGTKVEGERLISEATEPDTDLLHQAAQFLTSLPVPLCGALFWQFLETGEQVYLPIELCPSIAKVS
jgi:hypothetical protein